MNQQVFRFEDGEVENVDGIELSGQRLAVWNIMKDGEWYSLSELSHNTGYAEASISARIRDFRKNKYGAHDVDRRKVGGLYFYRLIVDKK